MSTTVPPAPSTTVPAVADDHDMIEDVTTLQPACVDGPVAEAYGVCPGACVRCGTGAEGQRWRVAVDGRVLGSVCTSCAGEIRSGRINGSHELRAAVVAGSESGG